MRRVRRSLAALAALLLLAACARPAEPEADVSAFRTGDTVSTYWFDFTVTEAWTVDSYGPYTAGEGKKLVLCRLELTSTVEAPVPMGWDDFLLRWGEGDPPGEAAAPLPCRAGGLLPDEFDLAQGEPVSGLLLYELPADVDRAALAFRERFNEGESDSRYTEGELFQVWLELP